MVILLDYINRMDAALKISILSLLFSFVSIAWNIAKDIVLDRAKLSIHMFPGGEILDDRGVKRFMSAGAEVIIRGVKTTVSAEKIVFFITNVGRRDIEVDSICSEYIDNTGWQLPI